MLEIRRVAYEDVPDMWDFVALYIQEALIHDNGECDLASVYGSINSGYVDLWVVIDTQTKALVGAVTTSIISFPLKKSLDIYTVTIDAPRAQWFPLFRTLELYGEAMGCKDILTTGRLGLTRVLPKLGFKTVQVKMAKEIDNGR